MKKPLITILATGICTVASFILACNPDNPTPVPADSQCVCSGNYYRYTGGGDTVSLANAFTPNGDGRNDMVHLLSNQSLSNFSLTIYKGAQSVFTTTSQSVRWDGRTNGSVSTLPAGDFVARIRFTNGAGQAVNDCMCIHLLATNTAAHCIDRNGNNPATLYFEDQFDPATGTLIYSTGESICP